MDTIAEKGEPPKLESSVQKTNVIKSLRLSEIKEADDERVEISDEKPSKRSLISYIPHWITFANVIYSGCVILYIVTFIFSLVAYRQNYSKCVDYQMLQRDIYNFPYEYPCSSFLKQCIFNTPTDPGTGVGFVLLDNWANSTRACSKYSYKNCTTHKVNLEDFFYDQCSQEPFRATAFLPLVLFQIFGIPMPMAFRDIIEEHYGKKKVFKFLVANIAPLLIEFGKLGFIATNLYRLPSEGANLANYIYPGQILFTLTQMVLTYRFGQMKLPWIRAFIISVYNETFLLAVTGLVLQIVTYASSPDTWVSLGYQFTLLGYELARFQDMALFYLFSLITLILKLVADGSVEFLFNLMVTLAKSAIEKFNVNIRGLEATVQETNQRVAAGSNGVLDAAAAGDENREGAEKLFRKLTGRKAKTASMVAPHASNPGIAATLAFASIALNNSIDSGPAPAPAKLVAKKKPSVKNKRKSSWWWFLMNFRLDQVNWSDIFANAAKVAMNPSNVASGGMGAAVGSSVVAVTAVSKVMIDNEAKANAAVPEKNYTSLVLKVSDYYGLSTAGFDDGESSVATFNGPRSLCTDNQGAIYVADTNNNAIRLIYESTVSTIITYTDAGSLSLPSGIAYVNSTLVVFSDTMNNMIWGFNPKDPLYYPYFSVGNKQGGFDDGDFLNATFKNPQGLVVSNGDLFVADTNNSAVRKIDFISGQVSTISTGYTSSSSFSKRDLSGFLAPTQLAVDKNNSIYVVDSGNFAIAKIFSNQSTQWFAGSGKSSSDAGEGRDASFVDPYGVTIDSEGSVFVTDASGAVRKIFMNQTVTLSSIISIGSVGQPGGLFTDPSGALYCADTSTNSIIQINNYDSNAGLAKTKKKFAPPNPDDPLTMEPTPPVVITPAAPDSCIDTPKGELTVKWINSPTGTFLTTREIRTSKVELREVDGKSSLVCGPVTISAYATADCSGLPLSQTSTLKSVAKIINPVGEVSFSGFQITLPGTYYFVVSGFGYSSPCSTTFVTVSPSQPTQINWLAQPKGGILSYAFPELSRAEILDRYSNIVPVNSKAIFQLYTDNDCMVPVIGGTFLASIDRGIINANLSFPVDGTFRTQIIYNSVSSVCSEQFTITGAAYLAWLYQPIANVSFGLNFVQPPSVQAFDLNGNNATFFEDTVQLQIFNDSLCTNLDSSGILSPESMTASLGIADFPKMTYSKFGSFYFRAISLKTAISTNCSDLFTVFGVNPRIKWNVEPASSELGIFPFSVELSDTVIPLIGSNCTAMLFTDNFCRLAAKSWLIGNSGLSDKGGICSITNFMMTSNTPGSYYVGVESNGYLVCGSKPVQLQSYVTINLLKNNLTVFAGGLIDPISASVRDLKSVVCTVKFYTDSLCSVAIDFTLDNVASTDSSSICKFSSLRVNTVGNYYIGISAGVSEVSCSAFFISVIAKESIKWKVAPLGGSAKFSPVNSFAVNTTDDYGNFLVNATVYVTIHAYPYCSGPELTFVSPNTNLTDNFGVATFGNLIVDTPEASSYFIKARVGNAFICSASAITIGAFNLVTSWKEIPSCDTTVGTFCDPLTVTAIDTTLIAGGNKCRVCNAKLYSDTLCNQTVSGVGNIWSTTDEFGVCTFPSLTYDVPGIYSVRVVSGSVYTGCSPLSLKFSLGNLTRIQWDTPPTATSRGLLPFSVNLTDTVRPLTSVTCSASVYQDPYCANPANVTIAGNSSISDENGQCKFSNFLVPSYTSASYYIGVNYGQNLVCTSNTVLFQSYITFPSIPEVTVEAGSIVDPISAFVFDTNPVNCSISFYTDQSCLSSVFSSSNVETNSNGYCTFSNLQIQGAGKYYVGLSVGSTISICSTSSVTVIAKEAISWNSAPYGGSALGSPINEFSVNTTDEFNNFRVNATVSVSIFIYPNCTGPELTFLSSNSNLTDNFGVATFNTLLVNSSEVSSYYLKASAGNASICSSSPITVGHENIITAWKTVPSCNATVTTLCDSASLNVLVYDLSDLAGNACRACTLTAYADDTCTTPITSGYYGNSAITDSDGLCNFSQLSFYFTGNYSVKVSSGSVSTGCSPLSMQIQPIGSISWITQPHCQETSCDPFSAIVRDQNSVPIPSVACTFGIFGDSSCSSSLATTVTAYTDSSGICSSSSFPTSDQGLYSFAAFVEDTKSPCSNNTVWNIIHSYQAYDDSYHLVVDDYENIVYEEWSSRTLRNLTNMNSLLQTAISPFTGMTIDKDGNIYCTLMNNPNLFYHNATSLEWTQVTGVMPTPNGMGLDETGQKIYICASNKIFVYDLTSRQLSIFNAALGITCQSIAVTSDGRIWLSDGTTYLSVVNSTTVINLVGGGSTYDGKGLNAILANTKSITTDGTNIYTVDSDGGTLRMIDANLNVYTIAGTRNVHNSIDGAGKRALFYFPTGIFYKSGKLYVIDRDADPVIVKVLVPAGSYYAYVGFPV